MAEQAANLITAASVLFALFFTIAVDAIGTYAWMTDNLVQAFTGYLQVQKKRLLGK
ncbi:MAG: hypothetical protein U0Z17_10535 [Bacteroidales bacterium]